MQNRNNFTRHPLCLLTYSPLILRLLGSLLWGNRILQSYHTIANIFLTPVPKDIFKPQPLPGIQSRLAILQLQECIINVHVFLNLRLQRNKYEC